MSTIVTLWISSTTPISAHLSAIAVPMLSLITRRWWAMDANICSIRSAIMNRIQRRAKMNCVHSVLRELRTTSYVLRLSRCGTGWRWMKRSCCGSRWAEWTTMTVLRSWMRWRIGVSSKNGLIFDYYIFNWTFATTLTIILLPAMLTLSHLNSDRPNLWV